MRTQEIFHINNNVRLMRIALIPRTNEKPLQKDYGNTFNEKINLPSHQIEKLLKK